MSEDRYDFKGIEARWQQRWEEQQSFAAREGEDRHYALTMYPYPSGRLHMGHVLNYSLGDVLVRWHLMRGRSVLSPMGWDSFGLPAENAAIKAAKAHTGPGLPITPAEFTRRNIDDMRVQMKRAGWGFDWDREIATSHPGYYRWTQWLFLQLLKGGHAFRAWGPVNWCPTCQTVVANEQVLDDATCERCGDEVVQREMEQWYFDQARYAPRLLEGHETLRDRWPDAVIKMQQEWIGRSEGALLNFTVEAPGSPADGQALPVFTTRPDTTYGVTFMALAPEHPLVNDLVAGTDREQPVLDAVRQMKTVAIAQRLSPKSEKFGVFTGRWVRNPFDGSIAELWVTNYAVMHYGTGAVMAVPAHDQRDFLFARKYDLPVVVVIQPEGDEIAAGEMTEAHEGTGRMVHSGPFDGMSSSEAIHAMTRHASQSGHGKPHVHFRLRNWLVSRQRYWGCPIPVVYCDRCGDSNGVVPVPEQDLPVRLPEELDLSPRGESPLAACETFAHTTCPSCGGPARRETDTMDTFVDSSWYFLRYPSPRDEDVAFDRDRVRQWLPVHQYIGGIEHATGHLIYARYFTMVLHDLGLIDFEEPFDRLFCQGMLCMTAYRCPTTGCRSWLAESELDTSGAEPRCPVCRFPVEVEMSKMSKTKKNGIAPDPFLDDWGADALRVSLLRAGRLDNHVEFEDLAAAADRLTVPGQKFLKTLLNVVEGIRPHVARDPYDGPLEALEDRPRQLIRKTHQTIEKVSLALKTISQLNTAIAALDELRNAIKAMGIPAGDAEARVLRGSVETLVKLSNPFAPHLAEELWNRLGGETSLLEVAWPIADPAAVAVDEVTIVVRVNDKKRAQLAVPPDTDKATVRQLALAHPNVARYVDQGTVQQVVYVPGRLIKFVMR